MFKRMFGRDVASVADGPTPVASVRAPEVDDVALDAVPWAAVDVETTGLFVGAHDRVVEIAVVRVQAGEVISEWSTLVNPRRDLGRGRDIHGLWASDVIDAPGFDEIAGDLVAQLDGFVLAAHNLRFDLGFIAAEYGRLGIEIPSVPGVCTLELAGRLGVGRRNLADCCAHYGITGGCAHRALDDARATAQLVTRCVTELERRERVTSLRALGCQSGRVETGLWPLLPVSGRQYRRPAEHAERPRRGNDYLDRLVAKLDGTAIAADEMTLSYLALLDRALEDRRLSEAEADGLYALASDWRIGADRVRELHHSYLAALAGTAREDGIVTESEHRDLQMVADLLSIDRTRLDYLLRNESSDQPGAVAAAIGNGGSGSGGLEDHVGLSVCFTGALNCFYRREPISRELAEELAAQAGLIVKSGVSRKLDMLVVADPDTLSGKAQKARELGTRIIAERSFWKMIGVAAE